MDKEVSMQELEDAYSIMAGIIRKRGKKFLPVFKRLHEEIIQRRVDQDLVSIALEMAQMDQNSQLNYRIASVE